MNMMPPVKKYRMLQPKDWRSFLDKSMYSSPETRSITFDLTKHYAETDVSISSHFLQDSFLLHYKPWTDLVFDPISNNSWKSILEGEYQNPEFQSLNEKISRNSSLAMMATRNFLDAIVGTAQKQQNSIPSSVMQQVLQNQNQSQSGSQGPQTQNPPGQGSGGQPSPPFNFNNFMTALNGLQNGNAGNAIAYQSIMGAIQSAAIESTGQSLDMAGMIDGFTHTGIPMKKLMDPDEMREILSNRYIIALSKILKKLNTDNMGKNSTQPSVKRGIPIGVKNMRTFSEIPDILPQEFLDDDLLNYRIITRSVHVRERYSSMNKYLVYLDKSGSMGGTVSFGREYVPKIAISAASIMSLARTVKLHGGTLILKLFDTEVQEQITDMWELLKTLARVSADGGTNITNVLEDIVLYGNDYKSVIVSDGIDSIEESAAKNVSRMDVTSILIKTSNPLLEKYTKTNIINNFGLDNILMEV